MFKLRKREKKIGSYTSSSSASSPTIEGRPSHGHISNRSIQPVRTSSWLDNYSASHKSGVAQKSPSSQDLSSLSPQTGSEEYWARRAILAERLLSTRPVARYDATRLSMEDSKAQRQTQQSRHILTIWLLSTIICVLLVALLRQSWLHSKSSKPDGGHFTLSILSPFTSVVEHETSLMGFKSFLLTLIFSSVAIYLVYSYKLTSIR